MLTVCIGDKLLDFCKIKQKECTERLNTLKNQSKYNKTI